MNESFKKAFTKIKHAWEDNPLQVIFVAGIAAGGAAKLLNAMTASKNAKTWEKEVQRRRVMSK